MWLKRAEEEAVMRRFEIDYVLYHGIPNKHFNKQELRMFLCGLERYTDFRTGTWTYALYTADELLGEERLETVDFRRLRRLLRNDFDWIPTVIEYWGSWRSEPEDTFHIGGLVREVAYDRVDDHLQIWWSCLADSPREIVDTDIEISLHTLLELFESDQLLAASPVLAQLILGCFERDLKKGGFSETAFQSFDDHATRNELVEEALFYWDSDDLVYPFVEVILSKR